jgi:hypothetical protein
LNAGVSRILGALDGDDPFPGKELERVAALRATMQPRIQAEEARVLSRAADQGRAASELEDAEYARYLFEQTADAPSQWRDELQDSPTWRGESL